MKISNIKQRIGVDIDDSLFDFIGAYSIFNNFKYKTNLKKEDFKSHRFNEFRGGTMEEAVESVKEFYESSFFEKMQPFPDAIKTILHLKEKNDLFIITARLIELQKLTYFQINNYFPNIFSDISFASNYYTLAKNSGKTKAEICKEKGVSFLIDDSLNYARECVKEGIGAILLDSPWNQNGHVKGIIRVKNWKEIGDFLK